MWNQESAAEKRRLVAREFQRTDQELVRRMGDSLFVHAMQEGVALAPWTADEKLEHVQAFVEERKSDFRRVICDEFDYCNRREDPDFEDVVGLGVTIADCIFAAMTGLPIPPFMISVYLVRVGLAKFCGCS